MLLAYLLGAQFYFAVKIRPLYNLAILTNNLYREKKTAHKIIRKSKGKE
jgi:hypothetical protein